MKGTDDHLIMQWNTFEQQKEATICLMARNMTRESLLLKYCNIKIYLEFWIDAQYIPLIARHFVATKTNTQKITKKAKVVPGFPSSQTCQKSMFRVKGVANNIPGHQKTCFSKVVATQICFISTLIPGEMESILTRAYFADGVETSNQVFF